ncbi:uncharacterized protein LOC133284338 [Gastrolobium bilobum]|uniref:uncharacterized protein LOC133284338 n=1 Tax=Gastrolobium bilobum TaxID=150636 RepID=UPI002AAFB729|nr:uncharacterized protein LOC133284338 [Gastrolobium bilobum]
MANQAPLPDHLTNPSNSLYLHANENPALVLVTPLLNNKNYHTWLRAMKMALRSKNKLTFVDGTFTIPATTYPTYQAWDRCNTMVLSWIHHSIEPSIAKSILWIEKAQDAWKDLQERFSQTDVFRIADLQEEIQRLHQGESSVGDFFTQLKTLWDELDNLQPLPNCVCSASDKLKKCRERDQVIRFLKGLNDQYSHVRSQIMLIEPLPIMNKAFSLVTQQERQMNTELLTENISSSRVYAAEHQRGTYVPDHQRGRGNFYNRGRNGRGRGTKLCTHCGRTNHTVETCYAKHGYPPGFKVRGRTVSANAAFLDLIEDADGTKDTDKVSITQQEYQNFLDLMTQSKTDHAGDASSHTANFAQVQHAQVQHGSAFNVNSGKVLTQWILDTGATDHICSMSSLFSHFNKIIDPIAITLPNNQKVIAKYSGTVVLSEFLQLDNVLYVPEFQVNLISVGTQRAHCGA